jgi:hypothetical protein
VEAPKEQMMKEAMLLNASNKLKYKVVSQLLLTNYPSIRYPMIHFEKSY